MKPPARYSRELEAARGLAILLVLLLHYVHFFFRKPQIAEALGPLGFIVIEGRTGVTLFFVLSALLLVEPFIREWRGGRPVSVRRFYFRRALRIVPLYYFAVGVALVRVGDVGAALRSLLFVSDDFELRPFSLVWWSLRTEVQFYVFLGLSALALRSSRWRPWLVAAFGLVVAVHVAFVNEAFTRFGFAASEVPHMALLTFAHQWPVFAFGGALAYLRVRWGERWTAAARESRLLSNGGGDALLLIVVALLGVLLQSITRLPYSLVLARHPSFTTLEGALWTAFVAVLLFAPLRCRRLLVNPVFEFLGRISYSVYLVHIPLYWMLVELTPSFGQRFLFGPQLDTTAELFRGLAIALTAATLVSWATYRGIERPFLRMKDRVR